MAEDTIAKIHKLMQEKGFKKHATTQSAEFEFKYTHPNKNTVAICGWHGKGDWGTGKEVHDLYVNYKPVMQFPIGAKSGNHSTVDGTTLTEKGMVAQKKFLADVYAYLRGLVGSSPDW